MLRRRLNSIITSVNPRTLTGTSEHSFESTTVILQSRCVFLNSNLVHFAYINIVPQNFLPKLKRHILPRILDAVKLSNTPEATRCDPSISVLFKHDRLYQHNILRVNYTSYDVRRSQDTINARTSHCNVMVLADAEDSDDSTGRQASIFTTSTRPFMYARVLGTYHANVVYNGPGKPTYQQSHRIDFLWVRWYEQLGSKRCGWSARKLDCVRFVPVTDDHAFGFIDPADVLRACHIVPTFSKGKLHQGSGLSTCAQDSDDWRQYNVNRYVQVSMSDVAVALIPALTASWTAT